MRARAEEFRRAYFGLRFTGVSDRIPRGVGINSDEYS